METFSASGGFLGSLAMPFGSGLPIGFAIRANDTILRAAMTVRADNNGHGVFVPTVNVYRLAGDSAPIIAVLQVGAYKMRVSLPVGFRLRHVRGHHLIGLSADTLGRPMVQILEIDSAG